MRLNEITFSNALPIEGYGPGFFRIGGRVHEGAVAVYSGGVHAWGGYEDLETILAARDRLDVIFIGTGPSVAHIPTDLRRTLEEAGIGAEAMATDAACRTYNVLLSEARRVGIAALPV